ncbi:MAG TPA: siderophore ABC transporter substrate-binding protein [Chondromyces sp.]|nr:siderophore ABC transporter substrate-binding protein [Chondromyces sp.]
MVKKLSLFIISILFVLIAAACGSSNSSEQANASEEPKKESEEITITHKLGEVTFNKNPEKVVVFDFGTLDTLDKLGVEVAGLPKENIPQYLSKYEDEKYENTGSLKEPDFEKIHEIGPDLIIISGRQADLYDQFSEIAPTIYVELDQTKYMESFKNNATMIAEIFGKEEVVKEELAAIEETVKKVKEEASATGKNALVILANDGKVSAFGPSSRFGIIHDELGVTPVDENLEVSQHGQSITFEYIVEKNPDYLFVIDRGAVVGGESSAKQVVENDLVKTTKAFKEGNIVYLDPGYWYLSGGGLISVAEMAKQIQEGMK